MLLFNKFVWIKQQPWDIPNFPATMVKWQPKKNEADGKWSTSWSTAGADKSEKASEKFDKFDKIDAKGKREAAADHADADARLEADAALMLPQHLRRVVDECVKSNKILKLSAESDERGLDKVLVVVHFCRLCIDAAPATARKACILAPTVPIIRQFFDVAKRTPNLRARYVIGDSNVEIWKGKEWREVVERNDLILVSPQLFLNALERSFLSMGQFCALVFDECQHCVGAHPFSKILSEYFRPMQHPDSIRVLGVGTTLVKRD